MESLAYALLFDLIAREAFGVPLLPSDHKPFIYGGDDAPDGYAPYMAALVVGDRVRSHWCGGSIISRNLMLTAANCVEPLIMDDGSLFETFHTRSGSNQWNSGGTMVNIKDFHIHPKFDSKNYKNDVAVLGTDEIVSENVAIIGMAFDYVGEIDGCLVTGWGRRMEGDVLGDAGNALVRVSIGKLIGVVSSGPGCAEGGPDISVRISGQSIRDFLEQILNLYYD